MAALAQPFPLPASSRPAPKPTQAAGEDGWRTYTVQEPAGRKIRIRARDEATAIRGAQEWAVSNPKTPSPPDGFVLDAGSGPSNTNAPQGGEQVTLNIGGRRVKVGAEFLQMTPEQQSAAVEEIASQAGITGGQHGAQNPELARLEEGIRRAHAAGNADHVQILGQAYRELQAQGSAIPPPPPGFEIQTPMTGGQSGASITSQPPHGLKPGSREYANWAAQQARAGKTLPSVGEHQTTQSSILDPLVQGVTFGWGDELRGVTQGAIAAARGGDFGGAYTQTVDEARNALDRERRVNPVGSIAAEIAGAIPTGVGLGGQLAGRGAGIGMRALTGGAVGLGQGMLYGSGTSEASSVQGRALDGANGALVGGSIGAALPVLGAASRGVAAAVGNKLGPIINSAINPEGEAARRLGTAFLRDARANPQSVMGHADELVAQSAGIPLMNADRGGESLRALARSTANQSPEARQIISKTAEDRFVGQGQRATEFIRRLTGGNADDISFQQAIRDTARKVNEPRYRAAFEAPEAQAVWSPAIRQLMQSPRFLAAVRQAESRGADSAAISGFRAVKNPFEFRPDGSITLKTNPDGSRALPTLQFWNQVKRNLDGQIEAATRGAKPDRTLVSDLTQIKNMLVSDLDAKIPAYQVARRGAAGFFDAEDALDAGKKFANSARDVPEAKRAFAQFNAAERKAFQTGYASELIHRIMATRDRSNVIDQVFGNPSRREMIKLVFGPQKAKELEAYVRVETLVDQLRGALGNSTTARQLMEMGIGGIGGFAMTGGDWTGAIAGATLARGTRWAGEKVNARVMENLGKLLTSGNPTDLQKAKTNAMLSQQWMLGLMAMEKALEAPTRGGTISALNQ